jgi:hypothetical protein
MGRWLPPPSLDGLLSELLRAHALIESLRMRVELLEQAAHAPKPKRTKKVKT